MLFQTKFTFRLWSFSFCAIFICARLSICDDYVQDQISDIGEGVDQNFAFHPSMGRVRQRQTLRRIVQSYYRPRTAFPRNKLHPTSDIENEFDIDNSVQPVNTGFTRKPSLAQIAYLLRNSQNPYPSALTRAKVIMKSGDANGVSGVINLKQMKNGPVMIFGTLNGFPSAGKYGFHFHELPVENDDCESAGEHFNPYGNNHGGKDDSMKHIGDLGNAVVQYSGTAHIILTESDISLGKGLNSVLGRALVVHAYEDDLGQGRNRESLNSGNSGPRLACGTVMLIPPKLDAENNPNR